MNEKLPKQESGGMSGASEETKEVLNTTAKEKDPMPQERERQQAMAELKATISAEDNQGASSAVKKTPPVVAKAPEKEKGENLGGVLAKGFNFIGKLLKFGFMITVIGVSSLIGELANTKSSKGGGKGHASGDSHKKEHKEHAAPKGDHGGGGGHGGGGHGGGDHGGGGGGHAPKEKPHGAPAHHH